MEIHKIIEHIKKQLIQSLCYMYFKIFSIFFISISSSAEIKIQNARRFNRIEEKTELIMFHFQNDDNDDEYVHIDE